MTQTLQRLVAATPALLRSLEAAPLRPEAAASQVAAPLAAGNAEVLSAVTAARDQLLAALDGLPERADYEPAARNLRELASVSPSLMDWLSEVPVLAAPLVDSVAGLRGALAQLERALELLEEPLEAPGPRQAQMGAAGSRVKVVVRG